MARTVPAATAFAAACLGIAVFSCMDAVMKGQSIALGAYNAMLWRSIAGVPLSGALFLFHRGRWPGAGMMWLHVRRSAAAGISVLLFFWGLIRVPMAEAVALTFLSPVFAILLAAPMLGERIRRSAVGACALALAGLAVIVAGKIGGAGGPQALRGALAIVAGSLIYAYNLVLLRRSAQLSGPVEIAFMTNVVLVVLYGLAAPVLAATPAPGHLPWMMLAAALALASSMLLSWAYAHAEAQRIVPAEYTALIWSALLGALVFGERVMPATLAGAALIIGGCLIAARDRAGPMTEAAA